MMEPYVSDIYVWFKYNLDRNTTHPKFDLTGVRTFEIIDSTFHDPETLILTNEP